MKYNFWKRFCNYICEFHVEIPPFRASDEPCSSSGHIRITDGDESMFVLRSSSRLIYYA